MKRGMIFNNKLDSYHEICNKVDFFEEITFIRRFIL